jgi:hypothetical protein
MSSIEKEDQLPVKRVMSEKQLENLRIGRERGVEKKRMAKLEREGIPPEEAPLPPPPAVVQPKRVRASRAKPKVVPEEVLPPPPPVVPEVVPEVVVKPKRVRAKPQPKIDPAIQYEQQRMEANEQQYYYQQPPPQYNPYYFQPQYQPQQQPIPQPRRRGFRRI